MPIGEICNVDVICCDAKASVSDVAKLMREHHVGDVIVTGMQAQSRVPLGIVTDRDIVVEAVAPGIDLGLITAGDVMTSPLMTVDENAGLFETLELMRSLKVRRLPVVREDGTLFGIVTADDIVNLLSVELAMVSRVMAKQPDVERRVRQ
ncbi:MULTISPECIES: CBS domain-containing protein [Oxalobacteraceae]|uniref:CBS domain-containing protein n=1 Tax=Oxalobacteraceae TaxID=75682 RepID=UPI0010A36BA7|nr:MULTISPECIES: CBS domain-containing protein [Oxalobacteraceae]HJV51030.1 CBS domain-containing protein [Noviherbaspirillum sp.]HJV79527.1 CBS domain-containing protein [Noviherbaspirillum sp.]